MKLKKLILSGFKSFVDRTEFEFDEGVTCIVGPNGCGKSNLVDAFKWVLGEQSAKSLRGAEMMDVLFNGCATRRPAGHAEITLIFDNSEGVLQYDGALAEGNNGLVSVGRRLYRNGQSEYLINKTPVRLRDVREMFMDTGVGVDAYSLIEQGRVEVFLQSSQEDRRAIFDEAAGISKYKARKKEALRKLERVEQNLLRITDILAEVEKRLRSIKHQAGKARSYQAHSERLKGLRSLHFLAQYHALTQQRSQLQRRLDAATDALAAVNAQRDQLEAARSASEVEAVDQERAARDLQGEIAAVSGQITAREERVEMLAARITELGDQILTISRRCEELEAKIEVLQAELGAREGEMAQIETQTADMARQCETVRAEHASAQQEITCLQDRLEDEKTGTIDLLRRTAQLHNEIHSHELRRDSLHGQQERLNGRADEIDQVLRGTLTERAELETKLTDVREVLEATEQRLAETREARKALDDGEHRLQEELSAARERRSAALSRTEALREMQTRREGVAEGVRRLLDAQRQDRLPAIRGMLGDCIRTDTAHARIVEAALAGADQSLLIERFDDLSAAAVALDEALADGGAAEILCLDRLPPLRADFDASQCAQILGRVIDWVQFDPWLGPAMWRLLGRTFLVRSLGDAVVAAESAPAGARFVTAAGDVLEPDGRVRLGAANRAAGVISRRSELAELAAALGELDEKIAEYQGRHQSMRDEIRHLDDVQQKLRTAVYEANTERVEAESRLGQIHAQIESLEREKPLVTEDLKHVSQEIEFAVRSGHEAREKAADLERIQAERQAEIERLSGQIAATRVRRDRLGSRLTELKVALAQVGERKLALREAASGLQRQQEQMGRDLAAGRSEIEGHRARRGDAESAAAAAREEIERLYGRLEARKQEAAEVEESRRGLLQKIEEIRKLLGEKRHAEQQAQTELNGVRVELSETDVRIENLISRAAEEMGMDLHSLYPSYEHDDERDWDAVENEIHDLREKIERLGNVNLDAISEQDELEQRGKFLKEQLDDVDSSKNRLNELIRRINRESREKFTRTFEQIRSHFQELFRKLFGGGRADVFLLDPEDVLESGIEVVARPPGKDLRSISLLSGGEKTMTAIALLFSIFRTRPSPVCLLDEVDAALDEANNERFNRLVAEFVDTSQFLIITHAKRTMSMANVLYGVTMQEPGVSQRISVRFEDAAETLDEQLAPAAS